MRTPLNGLRPPTALPQGITIVNVQVLWATGIPVFVSLPAGVELASQDFIGGVIRLPKGSYYWSWQLTIWVECLTEVVRSGTWI